MRKLRKLREVLKVPEPEKVKPVEKPKKAAPVEWVKEKARVEAGWRMAKSLEVLRKEINASAPGREKDMDGGVGDLAHKRRVSDHNPCPCHNVVCARDFDDDVRDGFSCEEFCNWLSKRVSTGKEPRVKYVIWNKRIFSGMGQNYPAGEWRHYSGSNPHTEHCHVSVAHGHEKFDSEVAWGWEEYST